MRRYTHCGLKSSIRVLFCGSSALKCPVLLQNLCRLAVGDFVLPLQHVRHELVAICAAYSICMTPAL